MDLDAALCESIVRVCGVPAGQVTSASRLEDLGIDSLTAAEINTDVEIRAGIELPMVVQRGLGGMRTVGEVAAHLQAGDLSDGPHLVEAAQDIHRQFDPGPDLHVGDDLRSGERVDAQVSQRRGRRDLVSGHAADPDD